MNKFTLLADAIRDAMDEEILEQLIAAHISVELDAAGVEHYAEIGSHIVVAYEEHPLVTHFILKHPDIIRVEKGGNRA